MDTQATLNDVTNRVHAMFTVIHEALISQLSEGVSTFTCQEAEAIRSAMEAVGFDPTLFMAWHATTDDDEGDMHDPIWDERYPDLPANWKYRS